MWLDSEPVGGCVAEYRAISQIRRDVGRAGFRTRVPSHGKPCYVASWGIACSTNRKNRVLRVPATTDPGDTKSPGSQPPKGGRASFSPRQSTAARSPQSTIRPLPQGNNNISCPHEQTYGSIFTRSERCHRR